jgi:hypothetical protein
MNETANWGAFEIKLSEEYLAMIGRATTYESMAKSLLSWSLKGLLGLSLSEWKEKDKLQFDAIVAELDEVVLQHQRLKSYFIPIKENQKKWRDSRNFVVHAIWAQDTLGEASAYCFRREKLGGKNDIVSAVNDCFCLVKHARLFNFEIAEMMANGVIKKSGQESGGLSVRTSKGSVKF